MGWNDTYWQNRNSRRERAANHHEKMLHEKADDIAFAVKNTKVYSLSVPDIKEKAGNPESIVVNLDTVSAIYEYGNDKTVALNFASYKNPGGGFLAGSSAQEEALCMESTLYEVLNDPHFAEFYAWNNQNKNKALYKNRALLSPHILFQKAGHEKYASILTAASPNRKAYMDYIGCANEAENLEALRDRIQFISDIINANDFEVAILGAYGCGVFGQDPEIVAGLFKECMAKTNVKKVIYAVIDKGGHSKEGAYAIFKRVIANWDMSKWN